jgi:hypothetical protein
MYTAELPANRRFPKMSNRAAVRVVLAALFVVSTASMSFSQEGPDRARVLQNAPIFLVPDANREPLRVAAAGTVLTLLMEQGDWVQIQFQDPQFGLRTGYIQKKFVNTSLDRLRPLDLSVRPAPQTTPVAQAQVTPPQRPSAPPTTGAPPNAGSGREPLSQVRNGFWFSLGMGLGSACNDGCLRGLSGGLSLGATVNPHVLFGLGTTGYYRELLGSKVEAGTLDARIRVYPWLNSGAFFTGGVGLGSISIDDESSFGVGFMPGFGWDIRVGRKVSLTPYYDWFLIRGNGLETNVEQLGLAFTIH